MASKGKGDWNFPFFSKAKAPVPGFSGLSPAKKLAFKVLVARTAETVKG